MPHVFQRLVDAQIAGDVGDVTAHRPRADLECQPVSKSRTEKPQPNLPIRKRLGHVIVLPEVVEGVGAIKQVEKFIFGVVEQREKMFHGVIISRWRAGN
jgi:hypothetical protein